MTDRERLIELLLKVDYALDTDGRKAKDSAEFIADYLLSDGWIRPPCKVGDTVYKCIFCKDGTGLIVEQYVVGFHLGEFPCTRRNRRQEYMVVYHKTTDAISRLNFKEIGKTVFFTREEAEKALAERQGKE